MDNIDDVLVFIDANPPSTDAGKTDPPYWPMLRLLASEVRRLRAMLDEAECNQSATRNHAEVFYRRLVAAQDALIAYPSIVTRLVRGSYGIDVNEHQIDAWLRGVMSKDSEKELAAHDARLLDEAADRAIAWLKTLHHEPEEGLPWSGKIRRMQDLQVQTLRAAIKGAAHE